MPDLNFDKHNTLYATHGLHPFAAKCPPQLVRYGLRYYSKQGELVLDPMVGSGTTLVEARLMGRNAIGYDLDPLAHLIAQVKSSPISDEEIQKAYTAVIERTRNDLAVIKSGSMPADLQRRVVLPEFENRDYWFSRDVALALAVLSFHIHHTRMSIAARNFLWVAFSSLILSKNSVANARDIIHSRHHFWRHPEPPDVLDKFSSRIKRMRKQMGDFQLRCLKSPPSVVKAELGDARRLPLENETIDLIFTSPPYATALDYPRAHFLAVAWMQSVFGVSLQEYRKKGATYIGSERGRLAGDFAICDQLAEFKLARFVILQLSKQSARHAKLIQRYFNDMNQVLAEMARVLKVRRHAIIVVCPSHLRKVKIPTHKVFAEMGRIHGLVLKREYTRTINERRRVLPYMKEAFGNRMSTEYVLIFQKL